MQTNFPCPRPRHIAGKRVQGGEVLLRGYVPEYGACGVRDITPKERYLKLLEFRHFERHIVFSQSERKEKKKAISNGVNVQVVVRV